MGKGTDVENTSTSNGVVAAGYEDGGYEWETAHTEAPDQILFDTVGDTYIGRYITHEIIYPEPEKKPTEWFVQLHYTDPTGAKFINAGYDLQRAFVSVTYNSDGSFEVKDKIPPQTIVRIVLMKLVDVDQQTPMKSFRVDAARPRINADSTSA